MNRARHDPPNGWVARTSPVRLAAAGCVAALLLIVTSSGTVVASGDRGPAPLPGPQPWSSIEVERITQGLECDDVLRDLRAAVHRAARELAPSPRQGGPIAIACIDSTPSQAVRAAVANSRDGARPPG